MRRLGGWLRDRLVGLSNRSPEKAKHPSLVFWSAIAIIGILFSTLLADTAAHHERTIFATDLLQHGVNPLLQNGGQNVRHVEVKLPPWYRDQAIYADIIREISFAFLIAALIGLFIERRSRARIEEEISRYSQEIARDVFLSTMRLSASESVWDELNTLISKMNLVRENLNVTYELVDLRKVPELVGEDDLIKNLEKKYIALKWTSDFWISNKSDIQVDHVLKYTYPIRSELDRASDLSTIHSITMGSITKTREEIDKDFPNIEMDEGERLLEWPLPIPPKERVRVTSVIYILKNRGDNEVWATILPTENLHLTLINSLNHPLDTGIQSNFPGQMVEQHPSQSGHVRRWSASRPLLPFQSVVVWWREPDAPEPAGKPLAPPGM